MNPSTNDFFAVREALSLQSNLQLQDALKACDQTQGWGINQTLVIDQKSVFVKRIPLTQKEYAQGFNTQNLYALPMYYHYGLGSAGFGAFRELICHQRVSDWVLQGHTAYFPLLYAYRIWSAQTSQGTRTPWRERSPEQWQQHLSYWNDNSQVAEYLSAREAAPYELVLFLEHVPETLFAYAQQKDERAFSLLAQASEGLRFLNQRGILHLDAHLGNLLTDGERVVISDFGLVLDQRFQLEPDEERFFAQHQHYDQAGIIGSLAYIFRQYLAQAAERPLSVEQLKQALNRLNGTPDFSLPPELAGLLLRYEEPLLVVSQFFEHLRQDPSKSTLWPTDLKLPLLFSL